MQRKRSPYATRNTRDELSNRDQLTASQLTDILEKALIGEKGRQKYKKPSEEAINKLTAILNRWRSEYYASQEGRKRNELLSEAENALRRLDLLIPKILEFRRIEAENDPFAKWRLEATDKIAKTLFDCQTRAYFRHSEQAYEIVQGWKWLIPVLPADFENAMRSTNPNFKLGFNQNGPLSRYVSAVIPFVTGDHPKTASIVGAIKTRNKKNLCV